MENLCSYLAFVSIIWSLHLNFLKMFYILLKLFNCNVLWCQNWCICQVCLILVKGTTGFYRRMFFTRHRAIIGTGAETLKWCVGVWMECRLCALRMNCQCKVKPLYQMLWINILQPTESRKSTNFLLKIDVLRVRKQKVLSLRNGHSELILLWMSESHAHH